MIFNEKFHNEVRENYANEDKIFSESILPASEPIAIPMPPILTAIN
jgi:hypothetical protein